MLTGVRSVAERSETAELSSQTHATYVASAGQDNQFKHPDPEIKLLINSIDRPFLVVSEAPRSLLWELVTLQQRR